MATTKLTEQDYMDAVARREIDTKELVALVKCADEWWKWDLEAPRPLRVRLHQAVTSHNASQLQVELCERVGLRLPSPPVLLPDEEVPLAD